MLHRLQLIIIILSLLHTSDVFAKKETVNSIALNNLLAIHREIISGSTSTEDIQANGTRLINETFNFIKNPKNKKLLDTAAGQDLLRRQTLLGNYIAVKAHFEKCVKDKKARRDLHSRILDSSLQSMSRKDLSIFPCTVFARQSNDFVGLNNQVMKTLKKGVSEEAKKTLKDTIMINGARALLNFKYKFDPAFTGSAKDIDSVAQMYNLKNKNILNDYFLKIKDSPRILNSGAIKDSLNQSINRLKISKTPEQFLKEVQSPVGALLLTPSMRERDKSISESDVANIIKESEDQILSEKKDTTEEKTTDGLVKINPFATGEMLLSHPEYAGIVCDAINKINTNDNSKEKRDHYVMLGTAVLGGALVLTGVGAMIGGYLITGSLTAGLVAGTVAGSLASGSAVASVVLGLGSALYEGGSAYQSHQEMVHLENAFLTNNGDANNLEDARRALVAFKASRTDAMISLASAGWNAIGFVKLFSMSQLASKGFAITQMKATQKIFDTLAESKVAIKLKSAMDAMGDVAMAKVDTFMLHLAKAGEATRTKVLELFRDSRFTPKELKEMMDEALTAAKSCT